MRAAMPRLATLAATMYAHPTPPPPVQADSSAAAASATATAPVHDMVPITRDLLATHYARFPDPRVSNPLRVLRRRLRQAREARPWTDDLDAVLKEELPTGLDSSMYKARCACEEAAERVRNLEGLDIFAARLQACAARFESFQERQREHVNSVIDQFLPQDFRATLFTAAKSSSEKRNAQAMRELMTNGGTVRDKYRLLWEQQWRRRENLAAVGNASGVWKWLVKYLAGVPQPLLSFAKNINAKDGPTEALREKFSGVLAELTMFAVEINALCVVVGDADEQVSALLEQSLGVYEGEIDAFVALLQKVITNSPFFIEPGQIEAAGKGKGKV